MKIYKIFLVSISLIGINSIKGMMESNISNSLNSFLITDQERAQKEISFVNALIRGKFIFNDSSHDSLQFANIQDENRIYNCNTDEVRSLFLDVTKQAQWVKDKSPLMTPAIWKLYNLSRQNLSPENEQQEIKKIMNNATLEDLYAFNLSHCYAFINNKDKARTTPEIITNRITLKNALLHGEFKKVQELYQKPLSLFPPLFE